MKDKEKKNKKIKNLPPPGHGVTVEYVEKGSPVFHGNRIEKLEEGSKKIELRLSALERNAERLRAGLRSVEKSAEVYYTVEEEREKELKRGMLKRSILVSAISWVIAIVLICLID